MSVFPHEVRAVVSGLRIDGWHEYSISTDMLQPADGFSMSVRFTREAYELLTLDAPIDVYVDDTRILSGFVEDVETSSGPGGSMIAVTGRDRAGRLVDESSPLFAFGGLKLKDLGELIVGAREADPLFQQVILQNTRNRSLLRSVRARKAPAVSEPVLDAVAGTFGQIVNPSITYVAERKGISRSVARLYQPIVDPGIFTGRDRKRRVTPGQTRWQVLEDVIREARLLAWSTANGSDFFIGLPNHDQQAQWLFRQSRPGGDHPREGNCTIRIRESCAERYSKITAVGSARGSSSDYGSGVTKHRATILENPLENDGTGLTFSRRKELLITDDSIRSARDAQERAEREMIERDAGRVEVTVDAPGHSQLYAGRVPAIYAIDTIARVTDEVTGFDQDCIVTSVEFTRSRDSGSRASLRLVPRGTLLQL